MLWLSSTLISFGDDVIHIGVEDISITYVWKEVSRQVGGCAGDINIGECEDRDLVFEYVQRFVGHRIDFKESAQEGV